MTDLERREQLSKLVYYSIDKASPFDLALHLETNELAKLLPFTLAALNITGSGSTDLWLRINAYIGPLGGKPIPPSVAGKADTVQKVWNAVLASAGLATSGDGYV